MIEAITLSTLMSVAPNVVHRAQRLEYAVQLLQSHTSEQIVRKRLQDTYNCSWATAWRTVEMARDIV
jgi:hypothetical protein